MCDYSIMGWSSWECLPHFVSALKHLSVHLNFKTDWKVFTPIWALMMFCQSTAFSLFISCLWLITKQSLQSTKLAHTIEVERFSSRSLAPTSMTDCSWKFSFGPRENQIIDFFIPHTFVVDNNAFINFALQSGNFSEDMIPTVGFNMRKVTKGNVTIKVWGEWLWQNFEKDLWLNLIFLDIGGQPRFRSMWERYCRGVNAIV